MKITLSQNLILDREAVFRVIADHFRSKGYNVANIQYVMDKDKSILHTVEIHMCDEEVEYE